MPLQMHNRHRLTAAEAQQQEAEARRIAREKEKNYKLPKVFYATRTHSQIAQVRQCSCCLRCAECDAGRGWPECQMPGDLACCDFSRQCSIHEGPLWLAQDSHGHDVQAGPCCEWQGGICCFLRDRTGFADFDILSRQQHAQENRGPKLGCSWCAMPLMAQQMPASSCAAAPVSCSTLCWRTFRSSGSSSVPSTGLGWLFWWVLPSCLNGSLRLRQNTCRVLMPPPC